MKLPTSAHTSQPWRIHELAPDFRVEDVWALPELNSPHDFPKLVQLIASLDPVHASSRIVRALFAIRHRIGNLTGWDRPATDAGPRRSTVRDRLPTDLLEGMRDGHADGAVFSTLYATEDEFAAELANRIVHGILHVGRVPNESGGYRGQLVVLVKPAGRIGTAYMTAIKRIRYLIDYPAILRQIERSWKRASNETPQVVSQ
jgi:uncharacterized protein DUF2867